MRILLGLLINALALLAVAYFVPGVHVDSLGGALIAALVLGVVNAVLRPILILLSLPLEILTLGLFTFVINAVTFYLVAQLHVGLTVSGFGAAFIGSLLLSIVSFVLAHLLPAKTV